MWLQAIGFGMLGFLIFLIVYAVTLNVICSLMVIGILVWIIIAVYLIADN